MMAYLSLFLCNLQAAIVCDRQIFNLTKFIGLHSNYYFIKLKKPTSFFVSLTSVLCHWNIPYCIRPRFSAEIMTHFNIYECIRRRVSCSRTMFVVDEGNNAIYSMYMNGLPTDVNYSTGDILSKTNLRISNVRSKSRYYIVINADTIFRKP